MEVELPWLLAPDLPLNKQVNLIWSSITLGHKMSLPVGQYIWPKIKLTQRCSSITLGHKMSLMGSYFWQLVNLTKVVILGHQMSLPGEGQVDILLDSQSASQPAAIGQPTSHVQKCQPVRPWVGHIAGRRRNGGPTTLGPSTPTGSPWGSDLPDQGQASDTNELKSSLYTIGTTYRDCLQFCIYII